MALVIGFKDRLLGQTTKSRVESLRSAEHQVLLATQNDCFPSEMKVLAWTNNSGISSDSQLGQLDPFLDENGIMPVG